MMTLKQNEFVASLTNLLIKTSVNDTTSGTRPNELVDACMVDGVEYGEGEAVISVDTLEVHDYSDTSSILSSEKPKLDEQQIETTDKKYIKVTINRWLSKGAFANEYSLAQCLSAIEAMLEKTKLIYIYKKAVQMIENWTPVQSTQTVTINLIDTSALSGTAKVEAEKANALAIYQKQRATALAMQAPSRKYNDIQFEELYNASQIDFIVNGKFDEIVNTYAYASLLNSDKLNNIQLYDKSIIIPEDQFNTEDNKTKTIGWMFSKKKCRISPRFTVATEFQDASTLNIQEYLHFWLNSALIKGLAGVKFVANYATE